MGVTNGPRPAQVFEVRQVRQTYTLRQSSPPCVLGLAWAPASAPPTPVCAPMGYHDHGAMVAAAAAATPPLVIVVAGAHGRRRHYDFLRAAAAEVFGSSVETAVLTPSEVAGSDWWAPCVPSAAEAPPVVWGCRFSRPVPAGPRGCFLCETGERVGCMWSLAQLNALPGAVPAGEGLRGE